jgi:phage antirepressor YoqD-like protein
MRRQSLLIPITTVAKSLGITAENMQAFEQGEGVLTADQFKKLQTTLRLSRNELCQGLAVA